MVQKQKTTRENLLWKRSLGSMEHLKGPRVKVQEAKGMQLSNGGKETGPSRRQEALGGIPVHGLLIPTWPLSVAQDGSPLPSPTLAPCPLVPWSKLSCPLLLFEDLALPLWQHRFAAVVIRTEVVHMTGAQFNRA